MTKSHHTAAARPGGRGSYCDTAKCARRFLAHAASPRPRVERALLAVGDRRAAGPRPPPGSPGSRGRPARAARRGPGCTRRCPARRSGPRWSPGRRGGPGATARASRAWPRASSVSAALSYSKWMSASGPPSPVPKRRRRRGRSRRRPRPPSARTSGPSSIGCAAARSPAAGGRPAPSPPGVGGEDRRALLAAAGGAGRGAPPGQDEAGQSAIDAERHEPSSRSTARHGPQSGWTLLPGPGGQGLDGAALPVGDRDLPAPAALAGEDEVAPVGRPGRVLAGAAALGDLPDLPGGQVDDGDVEAPRLEPGGVGDLAVLPRGVPGAAVVVVAAPTVRRRTLSPSPSMMPQLGGARCGSR